MEDVDLQKEYEALVVKPSTMQWLDDNGYTWEAEYKFPNSQRRVDFLATNNLNGQVLLVECKTGKHRAISKAIRQLNEYHELYPHLANRVLVYPAGVLAKRGRSLIEANGIALVELTEMTTYYKYFNQKWVSQFGYEIFPDKS